MEVNNFEQIKALLDFRTKDDFYFLQILQRKKDYKESGKVNGTNNNSRLIKAYFISSVEYLDFIIPEVIELCKLFNARAGINLNRRSFEQMALQHLRKITEQIINKSFNQSHKAYTSVVGSYSNESDKKWIIDLDGEAKNSFDYIYNMNEVICNIEPFGEKTICRVPSKNGSHLITSPFNVQEFKAKYPNVEIHKNNPTNLYIPQ